MGMKTRIVFFAGAGIGAAAGVGLALRASGMYQRSVRDEFQQAVEAVLFRVLDMTPFENAPADIVLQTQSTRSTSPYTGLDDVVLGESSAQSASGASQ
jgi:hypothetical protein